MQGNRGRDTKPELLVRRILHAGGLRYRVGIRPLPDLRRTADIVFTRQKVAVFIDGCFWHSCPVHTTRPKLNGDYWSLKLEANRIRDADTNARMAAAGWTVLRYWEHENAPEVADDISRRIKQAIRASS